MRFLRFLIAAFATCVTLMSSTSLLGQDSIAIDFDDPAFLAEIPLVTFGSAELRNEGGFGNSGYLSITDDENGQRGTALWHDVTQRRPRDPFRISALLRLGGGTESPGEGFSFSYVRSNDPLLTDVFEPTTETLDAAGSLGAFATSPTGESDVPEEGTLTGISIGIDARQSGPADPNANAEDCGSVSFDCVGVSIRLDGKLVHQAPFPTLNGELEDSTSLQTGGRGDPVDLGWAELTISVLPDDRNPSFSRIAVEYKDVMVFDERVEYVQESGVLVFGGRTGDVNAAHHVDHLAIISHISGHSFPGDFNEDGQIDFADFLVQAGNMNTDGKAYEDGDMDFDGAITLADFVEFRVSFTGYQSFVNGEPATSVPEPSLSAMLLGIAITCLWRRQRR